jgi:hypothetical protein
LHNEAVLWIAYPKITSKIATDLSRACSWDCVHNAGFESMDEVALDHVWTASRYARKAIAVKSARKAVKRSELHSAVAI